MRTFIWCFIFITLLVVQCIQAGDNDNEDENASSRSVIPTRKRGARHRRHHVLSSHDRRALRHRYNSVLAIGVGLGVAGGWICVATLVYVVRYMKAKQGADNRMDLEGDDLL